MNQLWRRLSQLFGLVLLFGFVIPMPALATEAQQTQEASSAPAAEAARKKFAFAYARAERHEWTLALEAYGQAFELYPHATTLYNMGYCRAQLGDLVGAWYQIGRALVGNEFEPSRRLSSERRALAEHQKRALAQQLVVLHLPESAVLAQLRIDGEAPIDVGFLEPGTLLVGSPAVESMAPTALPLGARKIYVNPGQYTVTLTRDGQARVQKLTLVEGQAVTLAELEAEQAAESGSNATSTTPLPPTSNQRDDFVVPPEPRQPVAKSRPLRRVGIVALATAGAGFGLALGAGIVAIRTNQHLDAVCDEHNSCPAEHSDDVDRYRKAAYLTHFGVALGAAGAITGVSLLWLDHEQQRPVSLAVSPSGVRLTTHF